MLFSGLKPRGQPSDAAEGEAAVVNDPSPVPGSPQGHRERWQPIKGAFPCRGWMAPLPAVWGTGSDFPRRRPRHCNRPLLSSPSATTSKGPSQFSLSDLVLLLKVHLWLLGNRLLLLASYLSGCCCSALCSGLFFLPPRCGPSLEFTQPAAVLLMRFLCTAPRIPS